MDSVLNQRLSVPFEVIISDDRSTDGTDIYVERMKSQAEVSVKNLIAIKYVHCNSNDCNPKNTSERCGWNKLNAYNNASGKYFVNVDADDYLKADDIYQLQIDALEAHPECSMCMQRVLSINEGDSLDKGYAWPQSPILKNGIIIDSQTFIQNDLRGLNQTYMIRRRPNDDMTHLYGKWFDDSVITYHHVQYGPVIFVDRSDYVWVQYGNSISHRMSKDDNAIVYGLLPLFHAELLPSIGLQFVQSGIPTLNHFLKTAPASLDLTQQYRAYFSQFHGFVYRYYLASKHRILEKCRLAVARLLLSSANRFEWKSPFICRMIIKVLV